MAQAWFDKHNDEAIELGNQLLEGEYLNPFVHDLFAKIYKESGEGDSLFHLLMFINIIASIQGCLLYTSFLFSPESKTC